MSDHDAMASSVPLASPKGFRLSVRDVAMMASISAARYLTAEALEWLHFPGWRSRWERHQDQGSRRPYYPASYLYRRLIFLIDQGWLYRIKRSVQTGVEAFTPEPDIFGILEDGAHIVAGYHRRVLETVHFDRKRVRSYHTLTHAAELGTFYAALRTKIEATANVQLLDWQGDHLTARAYDHLDVRRIGPRGNMETVRLPVQPDASFVLAHPGGREQFFVEIDRGTRSTQTWVEKIQAYAAYTNSPELKARYDTTRFYLLTVTPDATVEKRLMQATASVLGKAHGRYLFALRPSVHPATIGQKWTKLASVTPSTQIHRPTITTESHTLIQ